MTATVSLEISDYLPSGFNYEGFCFSFRTDNFEETIDFSKKNVILAQITNLKKDRKFTVRVTKNNSVVGISEIVLPQMLLLKREENFSKQIAISMIDSMKKALLGKDWNKTLQVVVKAKIEYKDENLGFPGSSSALAGYNSNGSNQASGPRSSSAKPVNNNLSSLTNPLAYSLDYSAGKTSLTGNLNTSPGKQRNNSLSNSANKKNSVKNNYNGPRGSIYTIKDKNQKPEVYDEFGDLEKSFIDSIFNDEHLPDFDQVDKTLTQFIQEFNTEKNSILESTDESLLYERTKNLIPKLFELQKLYYSQFNKANSTNKRLRELLIKYNEKYRIIVKKTNRLREALESNNIKSELTAFLNREENKRVVQTINLNKFEMSTFKKLFKIESTASEMQKFKQTQDANQAEKDKGVLLSIIENLYHKENVIDKIPEDKKIHFSYFIAKYGICKHEERKDSSLNALNSSADPKQRKSSSINGVSSPFSINKNDFVSNEENGENNYDSNSSPKKKLSFVKSSVADPIDKKIDDFLVNFYDKKRVSQIPIRRVSNGEYEYGTQRVSLKLEGDNIKVKTGAGIMPLDKFIEIYAPLEEARLVRAQSLNDKYKSNSSSGKGIGSDRNLNELNSAKNLGVGMAKNVSTNSNNKKK